MGKNCTANLPLNRWDSPNSITHPDHRLIHISPDPSCGRSSPWTTLFLAETCPESPYCFHRNQIFAANTGMDDEIVRLRLRANTITLISAMAFVAQFRMDFHIGMLSSTTFSKSRSVHTIRGCFLNINVVNHWRQAPIATAWSKDMWIRKWRNYLLVHRGIEG